jgi:hypothetical protein
LAFYCVKYLGGPPKIFSPKWLRCFMKRHKDTVKDGSCKPLELKREKINEEIINDFFADYNIFLADLVKQQDGRAVLPEVYIYYIYCKFFTLSKILFVHALLC